MKVLAAGLALVIAFPLSVEIAHLRGTDRAGGMEYGYRAGSAFEGDHPRTANLGGARPNGVSPLPPAWWAPVPGEEGEAQATEEVRAGYRIAKFVCRVCHIVEPAQASKPILEHPGPSFMDIANRPGVTVDSLKTFISTTDWDLRSRPIRMANKKLSDRSTEDVARYIISLKEPQR